VIDVKYSEYQDITSGGIDGKKWRYGGSWIKQQGGMERDEERQFRVDVLVTGDFFALLDLYGSDLEKVIFALVHKRIQDRYRTSEPEQHTDLVLSSRDVPEAREIDPQKVPDPNNRRFKSEVADGNPIGFGH